MFDKKLKFVKNKTIDKADFENREEYKYNKAVDVVPKRSKRLPVVILRENKSAKILFIKNKRESFRFQNCLYFIVPNGVHECDNGSRLAIYLEGISLPMSYENVEKEVVKVEYLDLDGSKKEKLITRIKNLKYDGKILDVFANREFARIFTTFMSDKTLLIILIVCAVSLILTGVGIGLNYWMIKGS